MTTASEAPNAAPPRTFSRHLAIAQDVALAGVSAVFFTVHARLLADGQFTSSFFAAEQGLLVVLFLFRRRPRATSARVNDWLVATVGGWLPLAMQPISDSGHTTATVGTMLQATGLTCTVVGFAYLGRSFGIVAADRGLQLAGPYRLVRHPIYLSHSVTMIGFIVANFALINCCLFVVIEACQVLRIFAEEKVLGNDRTYDEYRQRVRWRLLPGIF